ncbi:hypothetical protein SDC9_151572 [bioreactor metagenome]|uniref:Uncharacterized protein n=1 Tax=bioreactor metagenome TaxID=1076179 RepID=A0A645EQN3_9ZZZZ
MGQLSRGREIGRPVGQHDNIVIRNEMKYGIGDLRHLEGVIILQGFEGVRFFEIRVENGAAVRALEEPFAFELFQIPPYRHFGYV